MLGQPVGSFTFILSTMYSCVVVFTCNPNTQKVDTGLQVQGLSQVHSKSRKLKARLYETLSQKINIFF